MKKKVKLDISRLPDHIAIIMDGNGRWAKKKGLPRTIGHAAGAENFRKIALYCRDIGLKYLTIYAFSTENWKRPPEEISAIWDLLEKYLKESVEKMEEDQVKLHVMGDLSPMPDKICALIEQTNEISKRIKGTQYNVCINYGGRDEIVHAVRRLADRCASGQLNSNNITADMISDNLYSAGIPDPDLIIRPSGEMRLSNFLLWQSAYSEFYFTDTLWPDFKVSELEKALMDYQNRDRRFGGVKSK